jgi:hypothetical protein
MTIKRILIGASAGLLLVTAGFLLRGVKNDQADLIPSAHAQEPGRKCSLKTLKGAFGIKFEGQKIGVGPLASVSRVTFDGNGTFTTTETGTFHGQPFQRTFTGPYVVNDDCTGFLDFSSFITTPPHEAHGDFVIVNNGQEFFIVDIEEGWAANGIGKRIN